MKQVFFIIIILCFAKLSMAQVIDSQVIENANAYLNHSWEATSDNIWEDVDCGGKTVNTPFWVTPGTCSSLPYCWGGNSSLSDFDTYLTQGKSAGDDNTNVGYGAEPGCSVGVDCSGFVSRCYGLNNHYSTSMLNTNSQFGHYDSYDDLKAGDFINKPGSHTRLVTQINNNGTITVIESGSGTGNVGGNGLWRVFEWTYSVSELISDGYNPQYYTDMINSEDVPENNECINATVLESHQNCTYTNGTVDNAFESDVNVPSCDELSNHPKDVWYRFTASQSSHTVNISPNSVMNAVAVIYSGEDCQNLTELVCEGAISGDSGNELNLFYNQFIVGEDYWIRVYDYGNIDPTNGQFEVCITHSINSLGDIVLSHISASPLTVNTGESITLEAQQNYSGNQTDLPEVYLHYYLSSDCLLDTSDILLYDGDFSNINANTASEIEQETVTVPDSIASGDYFILFLADATNAIEESNEDNNLMCLEVKIINKQSVEAYDFQHQVQIYPNPSKDWVYIKADEGAIIERVSLLDLNGRFLKEFTKESFDKINISDFPKGMYFLRIENVKNQIGIFKLVKI